MMFLRVTTGNVFQGSYMKQDFTRIGDYTEDLFLEDGR